MTGTRPPKPAIEPISDPTGGEPSGPVTGIDFGPASDELVPTETPTEPPPAENLECHGGRVKMTVNGQSVTIEVSIAFDGPGATAENVEALLDSMTSAWYGSFGSYSLSTTINEGPGSFTAYVTDDPTATPRARLGGPELWLNPVTGGSDLRNTYNYRVAAHELGHSLGIDNDFI